jgi:predicted thioesterase
VGTRVHLEHTQALAVGAALKVRAVTVHVDGRLVRFDVLAEDADGVPVGHGQITRVVVDRERFLSRVPRP